MNDGNLSAKELAAFVERLAKQLGLADQKVHLEQLVKEVKQIRGIVGRLESQQTKWAGSAKEPAHS